MPEEYFWTGFFNVDLILSELFINSKINDLVEIGCGYGTFTIPSANQISGKLYAFDIDNGHIHFSIPYLLELLDYAKKNNKILILCSHNPVKNVTKSYQTKIETLEFICKYMKLNDLKFYTLSDLNNL